MRTTFVSLGFLFLFVSCNTDSEFRKLNSEFSVSNSLLMVGEILDLKNFSDSVAVNYQWDFGDGSSSEKRNPIHYYTTPGQYNIQLEVSDNAGNTNSFRHEVRVGDRYIYEIELLNVSEYKYFNQTEFWDEDSVGIQVLPDVFFQITGFNDNTVIFETETVYNVSQVNLPISFPIPDIKIQPINSYELGMHSFGLYLNDRDLNGFEVMTSNKMSGAGGSSYRYNKNEHKGEFIIGFYDSFKVKFKIK